MFFAIVILCNVIACFIKTKGVRINKANINICSFKGVKRNSARHQAQVTDMKTMEIVLIDHVNDDEDDFNDNIKDDDIQ